MRTTTYLLAALFTAFLATVSIPSMADTPSTDKPSTTAITTATASATPTKKTSAPAPKASAKTAPLWHCNQKQTKDCFHGTEEATTF